MKFKKCDVIILVASIALLIIGAGVYFIFRTPIRIFEMLGITQYQIVVLETQNPFNYFLVYCLPDALWYMSLLLLQTFFLAGKGLLNRLLIIIAIVLPFLLEIFQYFEIISGTFDWYDILTYCLTLIFYLLCLKKLFLPLYYK